MQCKKNNKKKKINIHKRRILNENIKRKYVQQKAKKNKIFVKQNKCKKIMFFFSSKTEMFTIQHTSAHT